MILAKASTIAAPRCGGARLIRRTLWTDVSLRTAHVRQNARPAGWRRARLVKAEMAGNYGETFDDISKHLTDLFTYKSVKTVLGQLAETDPSAYKWLYNFAVDHPPSRSYLFCKQLLKERRELGERVMETRVWLMREWYKRSKDSEVTDYVEDMNLKILRESLTDSVNFIFTAKPRPELGE